MRRSLIRNSITSEAKVVPVIMIIIIIFGFGIYGAAVVPDSGVGNTWQCLTLVLHEFLSNGLTLVVVYNNLLVTLVTLVTQKIVVDRPL